MPWCQRVARKTEDAHGKLGGRRPPGLAIDGQPNLVGRLGREPVKLQGRKQADDPAGNAFADLGQRAVFGRFRLGQDIKAPADAAKQARLAELAKIFSRDALFVEVPRPKHGRLLGQVSGFSGSRQSAWPGEVHFLDSCK